MFLPSDAVFFRQAGLSFEFLRMAAIFLAGAALIGRSSAEADPSVQRQLHTIAVGAGLVGAAFVWWGTFVGIDEMTEGAGLVRLGLNGRLVHIAMLLGLVLALAQLESVLRASRDPFRFRIKFVILGLCTLAGFELYVTSQTLLSGAWRVHHALLSGVAALMSVSWPSGWGACGSPARSTTSRCSRRRPGFMHVAGGRDYLLGVGLLGEALGFWAHVERAATELAVFVVTVALVSAASSRAVRSRFRDLVSRHLLRSRYDYRDQVAGGDRRLPRCGIGRAGARSPARGAGTHVRRTGDCRSSCATMRTTVFTRCAHSISRRRRRRSRRTTRWRRQSRGRTSRST